MDPVAYIRRTSVWASRKFFGIRLLNKYGEIDGSGSRQYVETHPLEIPTTEESLHYDQPKRPQRTCAGNAASLKLPKRDLDDLDERLAYRPSPKGQSPRKKNSGVVSEDRLDNLTLRVMRDSGDDWATPERAIAPNVQSDDDSSQPDWDKVLDCLGNLMELDHGRRVALKFQILGLGRKLAMDMQRDDEQRLGVQAGWKWVDRNWAEIERKIGYFLKGEPSQQRRPRVRSGRDVRKDTRMISKCGASNSGPVVTSIDDRPEGGFVRFDPSRARLLLMNDKPRYFTVTPDQFRDLVARGFLMPDALDATTNLNHYDFTKLLAELEHLNQGPKPMDTPSGPSNRRSLVERRGATGSLRFLAV